MQKFISLLTGTKLILASTLFFVLGVLLDLCNIKILINPIWLTIIISGIPIVYKAYFKLVKCRCFSAPLLISIAMFSAIYIDELFAAAEVALIMTYGGLLEHLTINKAKRGLKRLLQLTPTKARKVFSNNKTKLLSSDKIKKGDILRILPGEIIPADGVIVNGTSSINQANLTGESLPIDVDVNDKVMAGTINCYGTIDVTVEDIKDTYLQKMINLVKEADNRKAPTQKIVDKLASILVPSALVLALAVYVFTGEIIRAVTVLVVFCPCAMVLATPTSIMAAIGNASKQGIIIKSGEALEILGKIKTFVFDKTGTITSGKMKVSDVVSFDKNITSDKLLSIVASLEELSEHTIAKVIVNYAKEKNIISYKVKSFNMFPGKGVKGIVNGKSYLAGNIKFMQSQNIAINDLILSTVDEWGKLGKGFIFISDKTNILGAISFMDTIRSESKEAISKLKSMNDDCILLSGDNQYVVKNISELVGMDKFYGELLPIDKTKYIEDLQKQSIKVCMIGDGVNDAPALKLADIGIAMGEIGTDIAVDAADITLMNDNIENIPYIKKLSILTIKTIKTNLMISLVLNLIGIGLSINGLISPSTGAIMHNMGSIIVVLNAAYLYDRKLQ